MRSATRFLPGFVKAPLKKAVRHPSSPIIQAFVTLLVEFFILFHHAWGQHAFRALRGSRDLKLNLGCGLDIKPGWVNIDLFFLHPTDAVTKGTNTILINHDLRRRLPLEPESCRYIYSSHFLEHLDCATGLALLEDAYRLLKPGGVFRIVLPDCKRAFQAYLQQDWGYFDLITSTNHVFSQTGVMPDDVVLMDFINYTIYQHGEHKCAYDSEKLVQLLRRIGYKSVGESSYQEHIDLGEPIRVKYSFYVEAKK